MMNALMKKMGFVATEIKFCDFSFNSIWKRELGFWIRWILKDGNMFDNQKKKKKRGTCEIFQVLDKSALDVTVKKKI